VPISVFPLLAEAASASPRVGPPGLLDMAVLICPIVGHLLGAIPVGLLLGRAVKGIDLRQHGSGNIGATNAARVLGWKWGMVALVLDALKGMLSVLLARVWTAGSPSSLHIQVITGICAILGHMFPVWLKFKGGKGVATGLGVALVLSPISSLWALAAYGLGFGITRVSSVGSLVAAVTFPVAEWLRTGRGMFSAEHWSLGVFSLAIPALIIVRHRSNIVRLFRGQERALAPPTPPKSEEPG
jgi:acyl phosphate:glycerol-3-phosphate acyltransferase